MSIPLFPIDTTSAAWQRFQQAVDSVVFGGASPWTSAPWAFYPAVAYRVTGNAAYANRAISDAVAWVNAEYALVAAGKALQIAEDHYLYVRDRLPPIAATLDWCAGLMTADQIALLSGYVAQALFNLWNHK